MNKWAGVVVTVLLIAAGFVGAAYWSGQRAEHWYQESLAEASKNPNVKLHTVSYQRGWLSSQAVTRVEPLMPEASEIGMPNLAFAIRQAIYHGPLPLAGLGVSGVPMTPTGAVVRITLDAESSAWTRELKKLYGGQEPLVAVSQIDFDGASTTQVTMPPLTLSNVEDLKSLKFSGLQGQFQLAPHGTAISGGMNISNLELVGQPAASSDGKTAGDIQVNLGDITMTTQQRKGDFDLLFGDSSFKVGELRITDPAAKTPVIFKNLKMTANAAPHPQNPKQVNVDMVFGADQFTIEPWSGVGNLRLLMNNLDGATIGRLEQWQQEVTANPNDPQAIDDLLKELKALLAAKPEFILDSQAKLAQGDWQGKLTLNFQDFDDSALLQGTEGLLKQVLVKGVADINVYKTLAESVLIALNKQSVQTAGDDKAVQQLAAQQVAQQLQGMTAAGFLRLEADHYKTTARFEQGKLWVNDTEIPLGPAAGMMDMPTEQEEIPLEPDENPEEDQGQEPPIQN